MEGIKKIIIYERNGGVTKVKKDFLLFHIDQVEGGREVVAASDLSGDDNLQLLGMLVAMITNSVKKDLPPAIRGQAYMTILDTLKGAATQVFEEHQEDIALVIKDEMSEHLKKRIILPGDVN